MTQLIAPIIMPGTGELVELTAPTNTLAQHLSAFRDLDTESRRAKNLIQEELIRRLDHEGKASFTAGEWKLSATAPGATEYDGDLAYAVLMRAVERGILSETAAEDTCPPVVKRKAQKRELDRIAKLLPDDLRADLEAAAKPKARRVTLSHLAR